MSPPWLVAGYAALTLVGSLVGGWIPLLARMTHARMQLMMSGVAGLMLGVGLFLMLPHAAMELPLDDVAVWMMAGLLTTFFLQRFFHFHQHESPEIVAARGEPGEGHPHDHGPSHEHPHEHGHAHDNSHGEHSHHHEHSHQHAHGSHRLSWLGVGIGLVLHTLMDGVALAASVQADAGAGNPGLAGLGPFLAIFLHKPLDAMAITALMLAGGWSSKARHLVNLGFALVCPLGAALFYLSLGRLSAPEQVVVGCALAFSAGVFVCISLGDLLPEIQFHSHDRVKLSAALLVGVAVAYAIVRVEAWSHGGHGHSHGHSHEHEPARGHAHPPAVHED